MSISTILPLSQKVIDMYKCLIIKDKKKVKESYINTTGNESKSFQNLITKPEKFPPSLEERELITREVMRRYYAATQEGYLEARIEAEIMAELKTEEATAAPADKSIYEDWKSGRLGQKTRKSETI